MNISGRALHFVFKIGERKNTMKFYREVLGMKVIHYLFLDAKRLITNLTGAPTRGIRGRMRSSLQRVIFRALEFFLTPLLKNTHTFCRPYQTRWSKTMIGYGSEDTHFVVELTYNYGISCYEKGKRSTVTPFKN